MYNGRTTKTSGGGSLKRFERKILDIIQMTYSFLTRLCTEWYDRKPFEQIKSQILTCYVEQQRHQDFFEVRWTAAQKRHTKNKRPRQTINHVDT